MREESHHLPADRVISPRQLGEDDEAEISLRPRTLDEFVGQEKIKQSLGLYLTAAKQRREPLDHVLLSGPPGLGKTTLAHIIARDAGSNLQITSGPALEKPSDLAAMLTNLEFGDVIFIDEIHRLHRVVEEYLYPAMEDYKIDIRLDSGPAARSVRLDVKPFTLVGATTRTGMLTSPLRDRFGFTFRLGTYDDGELTAILKRSARILEVRIAPIACDLLSSRCRGTPRIANRFLRRCRDVAQVSRKPEIGDAEVRRTLEMLGVDELGLDEMDRKILVTLAQKFEGQPVGLNTLGAAVGEELETVSEVYEPYLIQLGLLKRTPRGRVATPRAIRHLGIPVGRVPDLFGD